MSIWTVPLRPGLPIAFDGDVFTVAEIEGRRVTLRQSGASRAAGWRQVDVVALLAHRSTRILVDQPPAAAAASAQLAQLDDSERDELAQRYEHVLEVRTGYRHGCPELALAGEPRPEYGLDVPMMERYAAKARELGVGVSTVRRWAARAEAGPVGLAGRTQSRTVLDRVDARWLDTAREVLAGHVKASRPVRALILMEVDARVVEAYGPGVVAAPGRTVAYGALRELDRGTNAFTGSTKGKRSIAKRPKGAYGRLRATRPGEYVVVDTTPLDVFAMEPVTCRWVRCELSVAMDLYSRAITGLRLTPVSTKAVDVAGVLFETIHAPAKARAGRAALAYVGVPSAVVVDAEKLVDGRGRALLPSVAAESLVFDHGEIYISEHLRSVCARFGISLAPARLGAPTDKPVERWFRTLGEGLLAALPGYKGPDVHSRGEKVEEEAFYFIDELEEIIRDWIESVYHVRGHAGLAVPEFPGLVLSPAEMLEHGISRAGPLVIPTRAASALEFLEVVHTSIQHYGVQIDSLRYNGPGLDPYRGQRSGVRGRYADKWPIAVDPGDVSRVYFQDPKDPSVWHELPWEHAAGLGAPFSREAAAYARRLAARTHRFPDTKRALAQLLERWGAGLTADRSERRMAVRLSQERLRWAAGALDEDQPSAPPERHTAARHQGTESGQVYDASAGDDDTAAECEAVFPGEVDEAVDEEDFYAEAWESR